MSRNRSRNLSMQRLRKQCPTCGNPLPVYEGRYPQRCKACRRLFPVIKPTIESLIESLIESALEETARYWIDPSGREYEIPGPMHAEWIWKHDSSLRREYGEYDSDMDTQIISSSLGDGWVRVSAPWFQIQEWNGKTRRIVNEFVYDHQELFKDRGGVNMERADGQRTTVPWETFVENDYKMPEILRWIGARKGP